VWFEVSIITYITAELLLVGVIGLILLIASVRRTVGPATQRYIWTLAIFGAFAAFILSLPNLLAGPSGVSWFESAMVSVRTFGTASIFLRALITFTAGLVLLMCRRMQIATPQQSAVFICILLGSAVGMMIMSQTANLLVLVMAMELASLPSYALVGFDKTDRTASEGSLKYVIFGAACSAIMLYGISLLYGQFGTLDFSSLEIHAKTASINPALAIGLACILVGLGFKVSLVPLHFWCPDAFQAAHGQVAAWLSIASKCAALLVMFKLIFWLPTELAAWKNYLPWIMGILAVVTMTVANLSAYWQKNVKRLLAYSSIAHAGYMLTAAAILLPQQNQLRAVAMAALMTYMFAYIFMNFGAFMICAAVERSSGGSDLAHFAGLGSRSPALAVMMMVFLFSLVGLPPLAGFVAKWILLAALWNSNLIWLVVAILANTVISLFYYMRVAQAMYFTTSDRGPLTLDRLSTAVISLAAMALLAMFVFWGNWTDMLQTWAYNGM